MDKVILLLLLLVRIVQSDGTAAGNADGKNKKAATDTSLRLSRLRSQLADNRIQAYIVPSGDFHLSEFVSDYDRRVSYISGFTGSAGTAVITKDKAALWTDGRYFVQAKNQLSSDWILMKDGEPGVPSIGEWLIAELSDRAASQTSAVVGACPYFFRKDEWTGHDNALREGGIKLQPISNDLIDNIWEEKRQFPSTPINALPLKFAGKSWEQKVKDVEEKLQEDDVDVVVLTSLDETAWLFNMRATDIQGFVNDPFFYSFVIIERPMNSGQSKKANIRLYLKDFQKKLTDPPTDKATNITVAEHLHVKKNGDCRQSGKKCIKVLEYSFNRFINDLTTLARNKSVKRVWISYHCNYGVYSVIPEEKVRIGNTPAAMMKAKKNAVEVAGMRNAHIKDGAALTRFMAKLEREVRGGAKWTEIAAAEELSMYRRMQEDSRGDSFSAISSVGTHAAINHYVPSQETDVPITVDQFYLLDSGGQYLDGTTDVTRTFLFRDPTDFEKEVYTRVLMGQINLAQAIWRRGLLGRAIDAFARAPLWDVGLVFKHGTGHGIGHYLSVHEGPGRISNYHPRFEWDVPLEENMFFSDEPGYYDETKQLGVRLENIIYVTNVSTKYSDDMFGMETVTLFPYEPHMIDFSLMDDKQISWLLAYNQECLDKVGNLLKDQDDMDAYKWLKYRTDRVAQMATQNSASLCTPSPRTWVAAFIMVCVILIQ